VELPAINSSSTDTTSDTATSGSASGSSSGSANSSSGSSTTSNASGGGSTNTDSGNSETTSSSVINAKMVDAILANPHAKSADIERVLAYIKDHPDLVDNDTVDALKQKQVATLGANVAKSSTLENGMDAPSPSEAAQRTPDVVEAKPAPEREISPLEVLEKIKSDAKQVAFGKGMNAFESEEFGHGVRQNAALGSTNQQLTGAAISSGAMAELAAIGGQLRGFLSGQTQIGNEQGMQLAVSTNQGVSNDQGVSAGRFA